ncbi:trypsin-like peptidase domain-containing protein [Mesonia sp. MT50]|uniref:Trypsin-like peptidase domain-containing protein n=1 Tax=Mesonia profundi TaxID=3070998 RepID=A0ABU1A1D0_9FLAO|nr:trypsin-like peptidase domain-containing protein [Mesonia profundi]MDQ7917510.1 trypsin-like peptidase domain-containing protein [Mesonia profundi]
MKKILTLVMVSVLGGAITLGAYKIFLEEDHVPITTSSQEQNPALNYVSHSNYSKNFNSKDADFTEAADKTVHAVVHVKNVAIGRTPGSIAEYMEYMRTGRRSNQTQRAIQGAGSGVIITEDGYIVTNNHVIKGASELEVTLNNNLTYKAEVIGTDERADIALIKINADQLDYLPFGDSDQIKLGEWVLAVGNPFNLTSTVTAGIVSAKGRDLSRGDQRMQSFIQTDAAINPGNSGGALVNINGELIGINTAITSQTGSYIGYGFAVPSNNARKIIEDILEYGDVQQAILGITGGTLNPEAAKKHKLSISQGVYISSTEDGAKKAGLKEGDLITNIDGIRIRKLEDLTSYIQTKRPNDEVQINYLRNGSEKITKVKLTKFETFVIEAAGIEITNAGESFLSQFNSTSGVKIYRPLSDQMDIPVNEFIITQVNDQRVSNVEDVKEVLKDKAPNQVTKLTFRNKQGQEESYIFR